MRDPKRIPKVIEAVMRAWEQSPDLRLGQILVGLAIGVGRDAFYVDDDDLVDLALKKAGPRPATEEYLRRNVLHCSSVGAKAGAEAALKRLKATKRPPAWLVKALEGVLERAAKVEPEMARHRDELSPYR